MLAGASGLWKHLLRLLLRSGDVSFFTYFPWTSAGFDASFLLFFRESITQGSDTSTTRRTGVMARSVDWETTWFGPQRWEGQHFGLWVG